MAFKKQKDRAKCDIALLYTKHGFAPTLAAMAEIVQKHVRGYTVRYDEEN